MSVFRDGGISGDWTLSPLLCTKTKRGNIFIRNCHYLKSWPLRPLKVRLVRKMPSLDFSNGIFSGCPRSHALFRAENSQCGLLHRWGSTFWTEREWQRSRCTSSSVRNRTWCSFGQIMGNGHPSGFTAIDKQLTRSYCVTVSSDK